MRFLLYMLIYTLLVATFTSEFIYKRAFNHGLQDGCIEGIRLTNADEIIIWTLSDMCYHGSKQ